MCNSLGFFIMNKMDINKERKAFEDKLKRMGKVDDSTFVKNEDGSYQMDIIHFGWKIWQAAKVQAIPDGFVVVPKTNSDKGIESMAMRYRHDFPLLGADYQEAIKSQMRQLYEEAVGLGFYNHKAQESGND